MPSSKMPKTGTKDVKLYDNALKGLTVIWATKKGILPKEQSDGQNSENEER